MVNITIWIPDELDNQIRTALAPVHKGDLKTFWITAGQKQVEAVLEGKCNKQTPQEALAELRKTQEATVIHNLLEEEAELKQIQTQT